jgi:hypothetical protein
MKGTWQTTEGGGGGGLGMAVLVILAVALIGPAVAAAVAELLHLLVIVLVALAALAGAGGLALVAFRVSHRRQETARLLYQVTPAPSRPAQLPSEPRPAIEAPRQLHLHFHGVQAEDVAAIIARDLPQPDVNRRKPPNVP